MSTVILKKSKMDLVAVWHRQIGRDRGQRLHDGPRPFAAVFLRYHGKPVDGLMELSQLRIDVLHDLRLGDGPIVHRLARYTAGLVGDGIKFGGPSRLQFEKYVNLMPGRRSWRRIQATDSMLLRTALEIDKCLQRHSRFSHYPRHSAPRLPHLWVSLNLDHPTGGGPEFEQLCRDTGWPAELALCSVRHLHRERWYYPLQYVSHHAQKISGALVDVRSIPRRQVFRIERAEDLIDDIGPCKFDFLSSRS